MNFQTVTNDSSFSNGLHSNGYSISMEKPSVIQRLSQTSNSKPDNSKNLNNGSWNSHDINFESQKILATEMEIDDDRSSRQFQDMPNLVLNSKDFSFPEKDAVR